MNEAAHAAYLLALEEHNRALGEAAARPLPRRQQHRSLRPPVGGLLVQTQTPKPRRSHDRRIRGASKADRARRQNSVSGRNELSG